MEIYNKDEKDFTTVKKTDRIHLAKISPDGSPLVLIKAKALIKSNPEDLFTLLYDIEKREKWDTVICDMEIVDRLEGNQDVLYSRFKAAMGATDRDFVQLRNYGFKEYNFDYIISMKSIESKKKPPIKKFIRAETIISGYLIKKVNQEDCELSIIAQTDIKGIVPRFIINYLAPKKPLEWIKKLEKALIKYK